MRQIPVPLRLRLVEEDNKEICNKSDGNKDFEEKLRRIKGKSMERREGCAIGEKLVGVGPL